MFMCVMFALRPVGTKLVHKAMIAVKMVKITDKTECCRVCSGCAPMWACGQISVVSSTTALH